LSRASYEKKWGKDYQKPTAWERFLAFLTKLVPKIGPLKILKLRTPTPQTERMFEASFNAALDQYKVLLGQVRTGDPTVPNDNFDTGDVTGPGKYFMNDNVHAKLLEALAKQNFTNMTPEMRAELLDFYSDPNASNATKRKPKEWAKVQTALQQLKNAPPPPVTAETTASDNEFSAF
jgi:hypothetical protein